MEVIQAGVAMAFEEEARLTDVVLIRCETTFQLSDRIHSHDKPCTIKVSDSTPLKVYGKATATPEIAAPVRSSPSLTSRTTFH